MKTFACVDSNNIVIGILEMNPMEKSFEGSIAYVQVVFADIAIPQIGQVWDGETFN